MEDKDKGKMSYQELFAKRQRLSELRNRIVQSRSRADNSEVNKTDELAKQPARSISIPKAKQRSPERVSQDEITKQPAGSKSIPKAYQRSPERVSQDGDEVNFYFNSDDSVKDKNYEPDDDSSCSHISNSSSDSTVTKRRKQHVKRRIFTPEKSDYHPYTVTKEVRKRPRPFPQNEDLVTLEDLIGSQSTFRQNYYFNDEFSCKSPNKKRYVKKTTVHVNEIGDLSDDSNPPLSTVIATKENELDVEVNFENHVPCDTIAVASSENNPLLITADIYPTMAIDPNGVAYLLPAENNQPGTEKPKKKVANPNTWKRIASKIARLKGSPYRSSVAKKKKDVESRMLKLPCFCKSKCYEKIPHEKRLLIFDQFWKKCCSWDQRRQFIVSNVMKITKKVMKTDGDLMTDRRKFSYVYKLTVDLESVKVCKVMFLNTLSIGEKFLKVSLEKQLEGGLTMPDLRGKHVPANKTPEPMVQSIMDHINSYPAYESHYSRESSGRKFLGPELNIATMYKQYRELKINDGTPDDLIGKEWLYRNIFNTKFNLSFKLPSVDTCDDCDGFARKLQDVLSEAEKEDTEKEKENHNKAAEERYNLKRSDKKDALNSSGKKKVLMFDLQKCLATPNLTNCKSFYLRKLWTLNLTIYDATSNVATNVIWSENISGRGGNEIASCLIRWAEENRSILEAVEELTLWSDNCAGQNRNLMIVMAYTWLLHRFPHLKVINHKFMLKGHTHMEVDQIHSQIERKKKQLKTMEIAIPRDWSQFIRTCGGRKQFEVFDMELQHFKDVTSLYKRGGPFVTRKKNRDGNVFKISDCVWLQLKQGQPGILFYKNGFSQVAFFEISLVRNASRGIAFPDDLPVLRKNEKPISTAKYNDLITLLQWVPAEFHNYYKKLIHSENASDFPEAD